MWSLPSAMYGWSSGDSRKRGSTMSTRADTHSNLGMAFLEMGDLGGAQACLERAVALNPEQTEAQNNLGNVYLKQGEPEAARKCYERAVRLNAGLAEAHNNLGNALRELGRLEEAQGRYEEALRLKPDYARAHDSLGVVLQMQDRMAEAAACHARAVQLDERDAGALNNLGAALRDMGRLTTAMECHQRALAVDPEDEKAHNNLGVVYRDLGRLEAAAACHERALELQPEYAEAMNNLGNVRRSQGRRAEARSCFERALTMKPGYASVLWNLSLLDLQEGKFAEGWRGYEVRMQRKRNAPRVFPQPQWRGEALEGKRILLHAEQGLGDTLQFLRYVPLVAARGGRVVLDVPGTLRRLAADLPVTKLTATGEPLGDFEWQCPLMSLPAAFGTTTDTIPGRAPYLTVPEEARRKAGELDWGEPGLRVGLVWSGNPKYGDDQVRSAPLAAMAPLLKMAGVRWFSLQMGAAAEQRAELEAQIAEGSGGRGPAGVRMTDLRSAIGDMADTGAVMEHLDVVMTVDTAVAHLAGALGRRVWVLLPYAADWRWLLEREDSPWYPTARLFRQARPGDWAEMVERVGAELAALVV